MTENRPGMPGRAAGRFGLSANLLKLIAIAAMVLDHAAFAFLPAASPWYVVLRFAGRITGPTMFFFVVEGYHHTRNANRYTLRMGLFALLSWLPFYFFQFGRLPGPQGFYPVGVIYTLFLGLLALRARHEVKSPVLQVLAILAALLLSAFGDWALYGIVFILIFDITRGHFGQTALWYGVVVLFTSAPFALVGDWPGLVINLGQFLPLGLLALYSGRRGGGGQVGKWFFYLFYPLQLVVLGLLKHGLPRW